MIILRYESKKKMKESIGKPLRYEETSMFGNEVKGTGEETVTGCNRPHITGYKREFIASVTLKDGVIVKVN